jgi:NADPH2:quinone reductase
VSDGVKKVKPGDRVYLAKSLSGTYAEYALALESQVHRLPEKVSFAQGAGVFVPYGTAYHALHHQAKARGGETVLIHGASGGVGIAAVQMARALGLTVFGTAGSAKGLELIQREGAQRAFDHTKPDYCDEILKATGGRGADIILEMLANVNLGNDLKLLAPMGRVVVIGSRGDVTITPRDIMARRASILAFTLWATTEAEGTDIHAGLIAGLENGTLRPVVGTELSLKDAPQAHIDVMKPSGAFGKIVLIP